MFDVIIISAFVIGGLIYGIREENKQRAYRAYRRRLKTPCDTLYENWSIQFCIHQPGEPRGPWRKSILIVTRKRLAIYHHPHLEPQFTIMPHEIQGYWRPQKYEQGQNAIWIHAQIGMNWHILKIRLQKTQFQRSDREQMQQLYRALKKISTPEQTRAYRFRPYFQRGPAGAYPAHQTLQGAWELDNSIRLYIMPLCLVVFQQNDVQQVFRLGDIQEITALKRMEGDEPAGLISFVHKDESFAFAMSDYKAWAAALAEAAKSALEDPVTRKRKGKDADDDDDF